MKIIDLLNKIANSEEVPYRIKYNGKIYEYAEEIKWYLRDDMKCELSNSKKCLNDIVEILEEKKIPEKIDIYEDEEGHYFIDKHCKKIYITCDEVNFMVEEFNQLIDYLKSKGE